MQSRTTRINATTVNRLKPGEIIWDRELRRFGVRRRGASISYVAKVRIDGRQRWITLGKHGPMTADAARREARLMLAEVDRGGDPTRERETRRQLPLLSDFADRWLDEHVAKKRKTATEHEYRRIVDRHLRPTLGKVRIDRIDRADVIELHAGLSDRPYLANRTVAVLSALMTYGEKMGYRPQQTNPCRGVERYREKKRKRPLSDAELGRLWAHLDRCEGNPFILGAIRFLLLTGLRREEALTLRWEYVDQEAGILRLPETKTGARDVILGESALQLLNSLPRIDGNPYVFPGSRRGGHLVNISKTWAAIRRKLAFDGCRIHDLRHTVASRLARVSPLITVRDALGHRVIATTSSYSHSENDEVRAAMNRVGKISCQN